MNNYLVGEITPGKIYKLYCSGIRLQRIINGHGVGVTQCHLVS